LIEKKFNYDSTNDIVPEGEIKEGKRIEKNPLPISIRKAGEKVSSSSNAPTSGGNRNKSRGGEKSTFGSKSREPFASGMQWHKLPKEILAQLGIEQPPSNDEHKENCLPPLIDQEAHSSNSRVNSLPKLDHSQRVSPDRIHTSSPQASSTQIHTPSKHDQLRPYSSVSSEESDFEKPRRVSFKDTPEKIPHIEGIDSQGTIFEDAQLNVSSLFKSTTYRTLKYAFKQLHFTFVNSNVC